MCLIGFHIKNHPTYKLIVAANRDEFFERPTAHASFWDDFPHVLGGRDLMHMGTWLGITRQGRFAALTNYRNLDEMNDNKVSRGEIVKNFLISNTHAEDYLQTLKAENKKYNGFNTVVGTVNNLFYYGNYQSDIIHLSDGTHALSNHLLNTPWPKVTQLKALLNKYITQHEIVMPDDLFNILKTEDRVSDEELPNTGLDLEFERLVSPIFITSPNYGTRSSTVILVTHDDHVQFYERTYENLGSYQEHNFSFQIDTSK